MANTKTYPNEELPQLFKVVQGWWMLDLDPLKQQIVKRSNLVKFFKTKGIINDEKEFDAIFKPMKMTEYSCITNPYAE